MGHNQPADLVVEAEYDEVQTDTQGGQEITECGESSERLDFLNIKIRPLQDVQTDLEDGCTRD